MLEEEKYILTVIWLGKWKDHMQIMIMVDALFIISHFLKEKDIVAVLITELQSPVVSVKSISLYARKNFP